MSGVVYMSCATASDSDHRRYSKEYIEGLESEIAELRKELQQQRRVDAPDPVSAPGAQPELELHSLPVPADGLPPTAHSAQQRYGESNNSVITDPPLSHISPNSSNGETDRSSPDRLIERLCGMRGRLSGGSDGRMRYFGPTSSLHLTESVSSMCV